MIYTETHNRCGEIKRQLFEVKEGIKNKAGDIMADFKMRGREALNRISEFVGLKDKLVGIRKKVKDGIADTNRIIAKIDAFGKGMCEATKQMNSKGVSLYREVWWHTLFD